MHIYIHSMCIAMCVHAHVHTHIAGYYLNNNNILEGSEHQNSLVIR